MSVLHLPIKKQWFDMIKSGEKKEEYREQSPHWKSRIEGKDLDLVRLRNGYSATSPQIDVPIKGIEIGEGKPEWGAVPGTEYFIIKLDN